MDPAAHEPVDPDASADPAPARPASELTELPERVVLEIDARIAAGTVVEGAGDPDQVARDLRLDRAMAAAHSRLANEIVVADDSTLCRECHEPRPCTTTTEIAAKYAVSTP